MRCGSTVTNRLEDYHKEMDSHNFELWFKNTLLPNLKPNSVILMDNAPYHSRKLVRRVAGVPKFCNSCKTMALRSL